jgi:UDP-glucose 4-epimerase
LVEVENVRVKDESTVNKSELFSADYEQKATSTLVVGASGFIGGKTLEKLFSRDARTISYDKIEPNINGKSSGWVEGDILDLSSIKKVCLDCKIDTVLHFIGLPVISSCQRNPHLSFLLNVVSVQNTLEAMRIADVKKIIFASSASVYGVSESKPIKEADSACPNTIYGYHKLIAENVIKAYSEQYGLDYVIFRLFNVYGAHPSSGKDVLSIFLRRALLGEPLIINGSGKFRDFIHVKDVAGIFLKALDKKATLMKTINVGSGSKTSLKELVELIKSHFQEIKTIEQISPDDCTGLYADISLAKKILDFQPVPPKEGIDAYISAVQSEQSQNNVS